MHRLGYLRGDQKERNSSKSRGSLLLVVVIKIYPRFLFCLLLHVVFTLIFCTGLVCCLTGFYQHNRDDDEAHVLLATRYTLSTGICMSYCLYIHCMGNFDNYITLKIAHTQIFVILHTSDLKDWPTANQLLFWEVLFYNQEF